MSESPPNPISPQRSPDGLWEWNGTEWVAVPQPSVAVSPTPVKKSHLVRNIVIGVVALIVVGASLSAMASGSTTSTADKKPGPVAAATVAPTTAPTKAPTAAPKATAVPAGPTLTNAQQNAARAAQQYLSISGFSRQGLIDQLSSSAGDGYSVQDATVAVDSLKVDWNAEAAQSAKAYMKISPFSCSGLIDQLDSSAGDQYTVAQATYGAQQAGAC